MCESQCSVNVFREYAVQYYTEDFHCRNLLRKKSYEIVAAHLKYGFPYFSSF